MESGALMTLALNVRRPSIPAGESVEVVVSLRNSSDVARPFYGVEPEDHTVQFELESPDGEVQTFDYNRARVRRGDDPVVHPQPEEITLEPGEAIEGVYQLCQMSGHLHPGTYHVRADYEGNYVTTEWHSFEIEQPQSIRRIRSTWDYNRTALSHLVSVVETPPEGRQKSVYWLEEGEKAHDFFYHHHALTTVPADADLFLAHTTSYLQTTRHLLWRTNAGSLKAVLVREGQVTGAPQRIHPPTENGRLLDTAYTTEENALILFATAFSRDMGVIFWRGELREGDGVDWTRLLEVPMDAQGAQEEKHPIVRVQYDTTDALHAILTRPGGTGFHYVQWDPALERKRQHHDVYVWRSFKDAFFEHVWADEDTFPPSIETKLSLLFRRTDRPRWERWSYALEEEELNKQTQPLGRPFPPNLVYVDGQLDKNGRLYCIWKWRGTHYYSRDDAPYLVRLDDGESQLFPQVLLDGDPVEEEATASCRYRNKQGEFYFRELSAPVDPELSLGLDGETVGSKDELTLSLTLANPGPDAVLLPALQAPEAGFTIYIGPEGASGRGDVYVPEARLQAPDRAPEEEGLPRGVKSCRVEPPESVTVPWFELEPDTEVDLRGHVPLDVEPDPYYAVARWGWADRETMTVSFSAV